MVKIVEAQRLGDDDPQIEAFTVSKLHRSHSHRFHSSQPGTHLNVHIVAVARETCLASSFYFSIS